jgi:hypothetical protein
MVRRRARHGYSASNFASLSFIYKSIVFLLSGLTDNSSSSLLLQHLLESTGYEPGAVS